MGVDKIIIKKINDYILNKIKPDLTIYLYANKITLINRVNKRSNNNRYDKFSSNFYDKVHKGYLAISKHKKNFIKINTDHSREHVQKVIFDLIQERIKIWKKK